MSRIDPAKQFSKKLAKWTAIFWFVFMTWVSIILVLQPQAALYAVYMGVIATAVMILNVWAYTKNSIYEKGALALLDKTRIELSMKPSNEKDGDTDDEEEVTEGGDNG